MGKLVECARPVVELQGVEQVGAMLMEVGGDGVELHGSLPESVERGGQIEHCIV